MLIGPIIGIYFLSSQTSRSISPFDRCTPRFRRRPGRRVAVSKLFVAFRKAETWDNDGCRASIGATIRGAVPVYMDIYELKQELSGPRPLPDRVYHVPSHTYRVNGLDRTIISSILPSSLCVHIRPSSLAGVRKNKC